MATNTVTDIISNKPEVIRKTTISTANIYRNGIIIGSYKGGTVVDVRNEPFVVKDENGYDIIAFELAGGTDEYIYGYIIGLSSNPTSSTGIYKDGMIQSPIPKSYRLKNDIINGVIPNTNGKDNILFKKGDIIKGDTIEKYIYNQRMEGIEAKPTVSGAYIETDTAFIPLSNLEEINSVGLGSVSDNKIYYVLVIIAIIIILKVKKIF